MGWITTPTRSNVKDTYVEDLSFSAGVSADVYEGWISITGDGKEQIEPVNSKTGKFSFVGLSSGKIYTITGLIKCYSYDMFGVLHWVADAGLGSHTIYTHPGSLPIDASPGNIIANTLTATFINNRWIPHFQEAYHWYNQNQDGYTNGTDYGPGKEYYSPNPDRNKSESKNGLMVRSGDPVYAVWFNNCMTAMRLIGKTDDKTKKVNGGPSGTTISADLIKQLSFDGIKTN